VTHICTGHGIDVTINDQGRLGLYTDQTGHIPLADPQSLVDVLSEEIKRKEYSNPCATD